jgi:uncharacterized protein YodC (DUF2158 family)/DNA-binding CsgD family transcriptional regulator
MSISQRCFHEGQRVRLGEGGPAMHVQGYDAAGQVVCSWWQPGEGWQKQSFEQSRLQATFRGRPPIKRPAPPRRPTFSSRNHSQSVPLSALEEVFGRIDDPALILFYRLTPRQQDVARVIASGMSVDQAASKLGLSIPTVYIHRLAVLKKLQVATDAGVARVVWLAELREAFQTDETAPAGRKKSKKKA